jgi:hypothetical protein
MRDVWYGDKRDLVKWGVLLALTQRFATKHILQVLYYQPEQWPQLEIDGDNVDLPTPVLAHFREVTAVSQIECSAEIEVVADVFAHRKEYQHVVINRIRARTQTPGIVFLDPDTGLESGAHRDPDRKHVLEDELAEIWIHLGIGDLLVFYQHQTNRAGKPWIEAKKEQFERALGVPRGAARIAQGTGIAQDVAFLFLQKTE